MSLVTVKVPYAPQPFACMRRSGITSRSNCAIFSINQMSCSSAGPRGPAVMMLVLSGTGAPVALADGGALRLVIGWRLVIAFLPLIQADGIGRGPRSGRGLRMLHVDAGS